MKVSIIIVISAILLLIIVLLMLTVGVVKIPMPIIFSIIFEKIFDFKIYENTNAQQIIIWNIRFQRIMLAVLVGTGLSISGVCFQTMFKNPLADPFILGISSGSALGAAVAIVGGFNNMLIVFAFFGAIFSLFLVYIFGWRDKYFDAQQYLLLAGVACGSLCNALLSIIMALNSKDIQIIIFWLMGSLSNYIDSIIPISLIVVGGFFVLLVFARDLDVLALGDDSAKLLGVNVNTVKHLLLLVTTLITGTCVAVSGVIGFIGLIVPHIIRRLIIINHFSLLSLSAIWGAIFLLISDSITRFLPILVNVPVGIITALFGSPFFLYILYSTGKKT